MVKELHCNIILFMTIKTLYMAVEILSAIVLNNVFSIIQSIGSGFHPIKTESTVISPNVVNSIGLTCSWIPFKKSKRKVQGVPQSQTAALPRPQEEEETDKSKQAQTQQTYEKH